MTAAVNSLEIMEMINHWIGTPVNGYLGSDYGCDLNSLLQLPISKVNQVADSLLDKLKKDVPILKALPAGSVNIFGQKVPETFDKYEIFITVYDNKISLGVTGSGLSSQ